MVRRQRPIDDNATTNPDARTCKGVIVGDNAVGKTILLRAFARCHPEDVYYPRKEGAQSVHTIVVNGKLENYKSTESVPDELLGEYIPTNACSEYRLDGISEHEEVAIRIWDTPSIVGWTEEETRARDAKRIEVYPHAEFVLLCFAVSSPSSLANVQKKWSHEVHLNAPEAKVILLGMKTEYRDDWEIKEALREKGLKPTTFEDGERVAREIGAVEYLECTVVDRESVVRVLETDDVRQDTALERTEP